MSIIPLLILFLVTNIFAACRSAPAPPTLTPIPIPTTPPFPAPDMEPILLREINFPARATSAQISFTPHPSFERVPLPAYFISVLYADGTEFAGRISFFFYTNSAILDSSWTAVLETVITPKEITGLGDLAVSDFSDIVFIRCLVLVHIKLVGTGPEELQIFAEQLDAQLTSLLCLSQ